MPYIVEKKAIPYNWLANSGESDPRMRVYPSNWQFRILKCGVSRSILILWWPFLVNRALLSFHGGVLTARTAFAVGGR